MIPASALERTNRVAVCTCGAMVLRFGTLKDIVFDITRRGWEYRNRVWRCGACARKEGVE